MTDKENEIPVHSKDSTNSEMERIRQRMALFQAHATKAVDASNQTRELSKKLSSTSIGAKGSRGSTTSMPAVISSAAPNHSELSALTNEILVYCHLLDSSRRRALDDCMGLRQTIKELEKLLDSARQREVEQQREAIAMFDKRYYSLKSRAKNFLKEAQEEKVKLTAEVEELRHRCTTLETKLYSAQTLNDDQSKELERLREQSRNMPSEKELQDMRLTILKLTDENGRLATERSVLIDEMKLLKKKSETNMKKDDNEGQEQTIRLLTKENQKLKDDLSRVEFENKELKAYIQSILDEMEPKITL